PIVKWEWRDAADPYTGVHVTPMVANINDDNDDGLINADDVPDIVVATTSNSLSTGHTMAIDGQSGQLPWKTLVNHHGLSDLAVGDIDGDGRPEIINIQCGPYGWDRRLAVLDNEGEVKTTGEWVNFGSVYYVPDGIALSDLDGDGKSEILWGENVHDHLARLVYPKVFTKTINPLAAIDLDADGYKELIGSTYLPNDNINIRLGIINYKEKKLLRRSTQHSPPQYNIIGKVENDSGPRLIRNTKYYKDTAVAAELFDMQLNRIKKYSGVLLQSNPP